MRAVLGNDKEPVWLLARMLGLRRPRRSVPGADGPGGVSSTKPLCGAFGTEQPSVSGPTLSPSSPCMLSTRPPPPHGDIATLAAGGPVLLCTPRPEPDPGVGGLEAGLATDRPGRSGCSSWPRSQGEMRTLARSLLRADANDEVLEVACDGEREPALGGTGGVVPSSPPRCWARKRRLLPSARSVR